LGMHEVGMEPPKTIELKLAYSTQGCGLFVPPEGARVTLLVNADESADQLREVVLQGDRDGLRALAATIMATVESPVDGYHLHLDEDANGPVFRSPDRFTLTIDRYPERKATAASRTSADRRTTQ